MIVLLDVVVVVGIVDVVVVGVVDTGVVVEVIVDVVNAGCVVGAAETKTMASRLL